jgi:mRNA interferase MazF
VICDFGTIVVVPFPFVELPVAKRRPALVLSSNSFNAENSQTVLVMITSAAHSAWPSDLAISNAANSGLLHNSTIRWKLFTLPNHLIVRRIGLLGDKDLQAVGAAARRYFAA